MKARYENKAAEWVRRVVLAVLLAVLLFAPGRCIYQNRTVAEMNEYVTAFTYKGESYRSVDPPYGYVLGTQIGKTQNGYRLFRAEGDAGEQFLIAEHIGPRADPICFAKEGTQIPGEGTVSSAIIGRKATADEHILRAVQAIMEAAQDEAVAYDEAGTGRLELYLCFEGCPVSNRSAGRFYMSTSRRGITKAARSQVRLHLSQTKDFCHFWKDSAFPGPGHGLRTSILPAERFSPFKNRDGGRAVVSAANRFAACCFPFAGGSGLLHRAAFGSPNRNPPAPVRRQTAPPPYLRPDISISAEESAGYACCPFGYFSSNSLSVPRKTFRSIYRSSPS